MAALPPSLAPSLASAYAPVNGWLTQDTTDPTGKGPVTTGPVENIGSPTDGTAPVDLTPAAGWTAPPEQAPDYFYQSAFPNAGPWPELPAAGDGKEPFGTLPPDGIMPAGYYRAPLEAQGFTQRETLAPGHDAHSQDTDTYGWDQYTPSGRTAVRQYWLQDYRGVDYYWPVTQPNAARAPLARGGNQAVNGTVATYGGLANSGGNTVLPAPEPAPVSQPAPGPSAPSTIPTWGF